MAIEPAVVQHVANLARLAITTDEIPLYAGQLSRILELMDQLNQVPTDGVEPMSHPVTLVMPEREDQVTHGNQRDAILACSPDSEDGHFRVPKIIE